VARPAICCTDGTVRASPGGGSGGRSQQAFTAGVHSRRSQQASTAGVHSRLLSRLHRRRLQQASQQQRPLRSVHSRDAGGIAVYIYIYICISIYIYI